MKNLMTEKREGVTWKKMGEEMHQRTMVKFFFRQLQSVQKKDAAFCEME
jgi:hypothetical protein